MRDHDRFDALAGAVLLGEASPQELAAYRSHLARCARCLGEGAGELELARLHAAVGAARGAETWQPDLRRGVRARIERERRRPLRLALGALASVSAIALIVAAAGGSGLFGRMRTMIADPPTVHVYEQQIILEKRSSYDHRTTLAAARIPGAVRPVAHAPARSQMKAAPVALARPRPVPHPVAAAIAERTAPARPDRLGALALAPRAPAVAALGDAPNRAAGAGDAGAFKPGSQSAANVIGTVDPLPEGGEAAIPSDYSALAQTERAQGTVAVEVAVDAAGRAQSVAVVKSSGYPVLDELVKAAALRVRYRPAMQGGRAVSGVYRFARTFSAEP